MTTERLLIKERHRQTLETLLREHLPDVEAWAYGSRVNGRGHDGSDLDLVLRGPELEEIPGRMLRDFEDAVRESNIPFLVEARDWARLPERFHREIARGYVVLHSPTVTNSWHEEKTSARSANWSEVTLGECVSLISDTCVPDESWPAVNYLDTGNITENRISDIQTFTVDKDRIPLRARRRVQPFDIVYSTVRPNQKHFGLLKDVPSNFVVSTGFAVVRANRAGADPGFIYWFLSQDSVVNQLQVIAEHSTSAYPSIRPSDINALRIKLPPLPEQRAIAQILGTLDDKIKLNRRMNETLEAMAQALFKSWFVDFDPVRAKMAGRDTGLPKYIADLFPTSFVGSGINAVPSGWEVSEIGREVKVVGGATPNTKESTFWSNGVHAWATPRDLSTLSSLPLLKTTKRITDAGLERISSGLLPVGTVLMSSRAPIGYLAITEMPTAINQGFIAMICQHRLPNLYVLYWCASNMQKIKGIAGGSTFAEISKRTFRPMPVVIPPAKTLDTFEIMTRSLYQRVVSNAKEIETLARMRDLLLPKIISGEVRVPDAEKMLEGIA